MSFTLEDKVRWDNLSPSLKAKFKDIIIQEILNYLNNGDLAKLLGGLSYKNLPPKIGTTDDTKLVFKTVNGDKVLSKIDVVKRKYKVMKNTAIHVWYTHGPSVMTGPSNIPEIYMFSNDNLFIARVNLDNLLDSTNFIKCNSYGDIASIQNGIVIFFDHNNNIHVLDLNNIPLRSDNTIDLSKLKTFSLYYMYNTNRQSDLWYLSWIIRLYYVKNHDSIVGICPIYSTEKIYLKLFGKDSYSKKEIDLNITFKNPVHLAGSVDLAYDTRRKILITYFYDNNWANPNNKIMHIRIFKNFDMDRFASDPSYMPTYTAIEENIDRDHKTLSIFKNNQRDCLDTITLTYDEKVDKYFMFLGYGFASSENIAGPIDSDTTFNVFEIDPNNILENNKSIFDNITKEYLDLSAIIKARSEANKTEISKTMIPFPCFGNIIFFYRKHNGNDQLFVAYMYRGEDALQNSDIYIPDYMFPKLDDPSRTRPVELTNNRIKKILSICNCSVMIAKVYYMNNTEYHCMFDENYKTLNTYETILTNYYRKFKRIDSIINHINSHGAIYKDNIDFEYIQKYNLWIIVAATKKNNDIYYYLYISEDELNTISAEHTYVVKNGYDMCSESTRIMHDAIKKCTFITSITTKDTKVNRHIDIIQDTSTNKTDFINLILNNQNKFVDGDNGWFLSKSDTLGSLTLNCDGYRYYICFMDETGGFIVKRSVINDCKLISTSKWEYFNISSNYEDSFYTLSDTNPVDDLNKSLDVGNNNLKKAKASVGEGHVFLGGRYSWFKGKKDIELKTDCTNYVYMSRKNKADDVTVEAFNKALLTISNPLRSNKPYSDPTMFETVLIGTIEVEGNQVIKVTPYPIGDNYLYLNFDITH